MSPEKKVVVANHTSEGFDYAEVAQGQRSVDASTRFAVAQALMRKSDCSVCHQVDIRSAGPAYTEIAEKYQSDPDASRKLAEKIRKGGSGVWDEVMMPAHPRITLNDATTIVAYILGIKDQTIATLPLSGRYVPVVPEEDNGRGSVIVRAAYTDRGAGDVPGQTAERVVILRSSTLSPGSADVIEGATTVVGGRGAGPVSVVPRSNGYIAFQQIDLTGIDQVELTAQARTREGSVGGTVELRLDGPEGVLIGQAEIAVTEFRFRRPPTATQQRQAGGATAGGAARPRANTGGGGFRGFRNAPTTMEVQETSGVHDLYFVFHNEAAREIDPLLRLSSITFISKREQ